MLTNDETLHFIAQHRNDSVPQLALAKHNTPNIDLPFALDQIAGWQTACQKLPSWAENPNILYPPHLSMEQCSSQTTAQYKADVVWQITNNLILKGETHKAKRNTTKDEQLTNKCEHTSFVDLTGGFGVDFSFIAQRFAHATYVEHQQQLCQLALHNLQALNLNQAEVVCCEAESYLERMQYTCCIYLDPARRDKNGAKTVLIEHCSPNVLELLPKLLAKCKVLAVKLSPMLHWQLALVKLRELGAWVRQLHIVAVKNECKELLFLITNGSYEDNGNNHSTNENSTDAPLNKLNFKGEQNVYTTNDTEITCYNDGACFRYMLAEAENTPQTTLQTNPQAGMFLYEPHAAIMKSGCFGLLCCRMGVEAFAPNSHLFISNNEVPNFPGRAFKLVSVSSFNKRELKTALQGIEKANIATRNFPLKPDALRKKLKLKDGGEHYLFATTDAEGKHWLLVGKQCHAHCLSPNVE